MAASSLYGISRNKLWVTAKRRNQGLVLPKAKNGPKPPAGLEPTEDKITRGVSFYVNDKMARAAAAEKAGVTDGTLRGT